MKNIFKSIFVFAAIATLASGCKGFLDEADQSKFIANSADHFSSVLLGEFNAMYDPFYLCPFMTDEITDGADVSLNSSGREAIRPAFCWQRDIEKNMTDYTRIDQSDFWAYGYKLIIICNNLFENIDECSESVPGEIDYVKAEASFVSAVMYFNLVNLYAEPYRAATATTTLGIPIKEDTGVETSYERATLAECYTKIVTLLTDALSYLEKSGIKYDSTSKIGEDVVRIFLSRVYLFMGEYDKAVSTLSPVMPHARLTKMVDDDVTYMEGNKEVVYTYGLWTQSIIKSMCESYFFNTCNDLYEKYDESDIRREAWFYAKEDKDRGILIVTPYKCGSSYYTTIGQIIVRYGEAYLNIAEAYARKGDTQNATNYLEKFLESRHYVMDDVVIPSSQKELVAYLMDERLREFCYEDHFRWFDLRRMTEEERPEITHTFKVMQNAVLVRTETYHLLKNDPNYTLSLPYKEKDNNPMILDYDRFDKVPF